MVSDLDLTARAKIRACALALFADNRPDAVTIREIASCAEVSPALVLHHFGSKQGLRDAVDEHVAGIFDALLGTDAGTDAGAGAPSVVNPEAFASLGEMLLEQLPPGTRIPAYLRRLILAGDPVGMALFRRWYELTLALDEQLISAGVMRPTDDPQTRAAFLMVNDLAMLLLRPHLIDALDLDPLSTKGMARWTSQATDAYVNGVFRSEEP